ncbi:MAG: fibronectin type III domain-containing protein, partial [Bacteroidota bacterium]
MKTIFHFFKKTSGVFGLVFFFLLGNINAQNNTPPKNQSSISLIAQSKDGQIQLRWAPADPAMWLEGIRKGYTIERQAIQPGKRFSPKQFEILNPTPIKPYPLTDFETAYRQSPENEYLLVAAECIYGDWKDAKKGAANLNNWIAASDDFYSKFSFHLFATEMNFIAAEASGFAFVDATAVRGQQYIYKVYIQGENGKKKYAVYQNVNNTEQPQPIPNIHSVENGEQKVVLSWARAWHNEHFSAYFIERSADGKSFKKINSTPYVHGLSDDANLHSPNIVFIDKVENYQPYFYRLRGVTPFGEWSAPSKIVKGMGVDKTPPAPARKVATQWIAGTTMEVSWEVVDSADAAHFYIARAQDYRGPYEILTPQPMLDPTARSHQDTSANPFGINYYVVGTVDTARNVSISNPIVGFIEDKEAPEPPMGLEGTVDTAGIVTLKWRRGAEVDLKGYYVYFSNAKKDVFTNLTNKPIAANEFRDTITLNTLTKKVYYRVAAIDRRGNYSKFSQFLELKRPDIIPPAAPVFKNYQVLDDGISLAWLP